MTAKTYHVLRQHLGDKDYFPGDTREAEPSHVAHLVRLNVLSEDAPAKPAKAEKAKATTKASK